MATTIHQRPLYTIQPTVLQCIWSAKNDAIVSGSPTFYANVKCVAKIYVSSQPSSIVQPSNLAATIKAVPNNAGISIFNIQRILESFCSPQQLGYYDGTADSEFKTFAANNLIYFSIHTIDKFSRNNSALKYYKIVFEFEGATAIGLPATAIPGSDITSDLYMVYNGYAPTNDNLVSWGGDFGWNISFDYLPAAATSRGFLSDAPLVQYARPEDYGTVSFFSSLNGVMADIDWISIRYYFEDGTSILENIQNLDANGGVSSPSSPPTGEESILYFGIFPGNLRGWNTNFQTYLTQANALTHYTYKLLGPTTRTQEWTIKMKCPNADGYKPVRVCWLNAGGGWDYYTFDMKSVKTLTAKQTTWQQTEGTWGDEYYKPSGYKGGTKTFRTNSKNKIKVNSDFLTEDEVEWFKTLVNSPEVYIIEDYTDNGAFGTVAFNTNAYTRPVRLKTSSYITKTIANDKLLQYTFEFEYSKGLRTQPV